MKKKRGRKFLLTPQVIKRAAKAAKRGALDYEVAEVIGVHPSTFCEWKGTYAELSEALKAAREKPIELVEAALFRSAIGYTHPDEKIGFSKSGAIRRAPYMRHYSPNPASIGIFLRARKPEVYRDQTSGGTAVAPKESGKLSFSEFCTRAGYPAPYLKQIEMKEFGINGEGVRLLLGSRGYGKTDYIVILGTAYEIYCNPLKFTALFVTKSDERNAAMMAEIGRVLLFHGVPLEKNNSESVRVGGLVGKEHSVAAVTIGTTSLRGRHPKLVIFDDPVTPEDTSPATRRRVKKVYDEVVGKICNNVLLIGQPVHRDDLYQTLRPKLKNKMEVPFGSIPELDPDLELQKLAGVSQETIDASYHLKIVSTNATPFDAVQYIDRLPSGPGVAWIDPSEGGDYTALCIAKGLFEGMAFEGFLYKKAWYHALPEMIERMKAAGVKKLGFETNTTGNDPIEKLSAMLPDGVGVTGKRTTKNKEAKIMNAGTFAPFIHLANSSDPLFIEQVVKYEVGVEYDDAPDSVASLLEWVGLIRGK